MPCCCTKTLFLCKISVCSDEIKTGVNAPSAGTYRLVTDFLGTTFTIDAAVEANAEIKFPSTDLNENYTFTAQILNPDGSVLSIVKDEIAFDCISFETTVTYAV